MSLRQFSSLNSGVKTISPRRSGTTPACLGIPYFSPKSVCIRATGEISILSSSKHSPFPPAIISFSEASLMEKISSFPPVSRIPVVYYFSSAFPFSRLSHENLQQNFRTFAVRLISNGHIHPGLLVYYSLEV